MQEMLRTILAELIGIKMSHARTLVKRVGGKTNIKDWLISKFPSHTVFVDVFGGSASVAISMVKYSDSNHRVVYNDSDEHVVNFFKVLRDNPDELCSLIELTPYSRKEFLLAHDILMSNEWKNFSEVERARLFLVYNRQSLFGKETKDWCIAKKGENIAKTWQKMPALASDVAISLKQCFIENLDYKKLLPKWDTESTLFYLDPPYLGVEKDFYKANIENGFNHNEMREMLGDMNGSWAVSYYDSPYIRELYNGFDIYEKEVVKHMQTKKNKDSVTEILIVKQNDYARKSTQSKVDIFDDGDEV